MLLIDNVPPNKWYVTVITQIVLNYFSSIENMNYFHFLLHTGRSHIKPSCEGHLPYVTMSELIHNRALKNFLRILRILLD